MLAANGWMNHPTGFTLDPTGQPTDIRPWAAFFNEAVWWQWPHMFLAAYMVVGFIVAGVYANGLRKGRRDRLHRLGFTIPFAFASVAAVIQPAVGHLAGARLADAQPSKLAAIELAVETERRAPLVVGGILVDGEVRYGLEIPAVGSLLAVNSLDGEVPGLADVPEGDEVPASLVHLSFQTMVGIGTALAVLVVGYWLARWRGRDPTDRSWFLAAAVMAGPAATIALLTGWITTEVGRQPWIAYRVMRVDEAVTDAGWIWWSLATVVVIYTSMTVIGARLLRSMSRRWRSGDDGTRVPYGPAEDAGPAGSARRPIEAGTGR